MLPAHVPRLGKKARLREDGPRGEIFLLYPERGLRLNSAAAAVLRLCDGTRTLGEIAGLLSERSRADKADVQMDVSGFLDSLAARGVVV